MRFRRGGRLCGLADRKRRGRSSATALLQPSAYTSPAGKRPDQITPAPGSFHNDDRSLFSIFWPPTTPEQIEAFSNYVRWMADHFRGRIHYYAAVE